MSPTTPAIAPLGAAAARRATRRDRHHQRNGQSLRRRVASLVAAGAAGAFAALTLLGCATALPGTDAAAAGASTPPLRIAAAASLEGAMPGLLAAFADAHPEVTVDPVTFDGSAVLAAQLRAGAPYDVFLAADQRTLDDLDAADLLASDPVPLAQNHLEIAVAPGNPLGVRGLADLATPHAADRDDDAEIGAGAGTPVVVMCSTEVPCGRAAADLLARAGIALGTELVPASSEQNVSAVLQKVTSGEADAGLVYRTDLVRADGAATGVAIADAAAAPTTLTAAVTANAPAERADAARAFVAFLQGDAARAVLRTAGFTGLPGGAS